MQPLLYGHAVLALATLAASAAPQSLPLPSWSGRVPSTAFNKSAGLRPVPGVQHKIVYSATAAGGPNPNGTYNHGPMMIACQGLFYMSWYNAPHGENMYKRSVFSTSGDGGDTWSPPITLFPNFTTYGEENGPWTLLGDRNDGTGGEKRLYTQSGTVDAGLHEEGIQSVMRRVGPGTKLGPIFWLNETVPERFKHLNFPTYLDMDPLTRRDAMQLLASFVRTTVRYPDLDSTTRNNHVSKEQQLGKMVYNERSLYKVPGTRQVVNLLRGGAPKTLSAAVCTLPSNPSLPAIVPDPTAFSCRAGVGDAFMNLVELLELPASANNSTKTLYEPRVCQFTDPVHISIPDSHSRTCASLLPGGAADGKGDAVYLVGNQIKSGRDPVTLSIARDGLHFDDHWAVNFGAPPILYPGEAKVVGYQYPGAMIFEDIFYVSYSIGKEDIGFSKFHVASVMATPKP